MPEDVNSQWRTVHYWWKIKKTHGQLMACRLDITSQDWCRLQLSLIVFKYTWQFLAGICLPTRSLTNIEGGKEHHTHTHTHLHARACPHACQPACPHACMQNTHTLKWWTINWIGHTLCGNCRLKHVIEGRTQGKIRWWTRHKQLLNVLKEKRSSLYLKQEATDHPLWRTLGNSLWKKLHNCHKTDHMMMMMMVMKMMVTTMTCI